MKKPLVSILVHTRNSQRTIKEHLESIKCQTYKQIEIVMVDNNSSDDTLVLAKHFTKNIFTCGPERSAQRNFGAKKAKGEFFLVPDVDMILGKDVVAQCVALVTSNSKIKAIIIPEKSIGIGFWARCKALERSYYMKVPWMQAARFFDKKTFFEMGGYDLENTGTEDFDLPQRIQLKYGKLSVGKIDDNILHDEGNLSLIRSLKKKFYYAQNLDIYKRANLTFYNKQANIFRRFLIYFSDPIKLFKNPVIGLGMLFMKTCEFTSGGLGHLFRKKIDVYGN
jgi:glycosyltransferase involved in cell wall biosynthesis